MTVTRLFPIAFFWRLLIALFTCTFFQPDEFFQSLEVAHHAVFGYGHLTWEWTASPPIRSIIFPALYMPVFWLLKVSNLDESYALIAAPKILQAFFAALADVSTWRLTKQVLGDRYCKTAFILSMTSFFNILALSRTLSNSVETSLTASALCFWPWQSNIQYGNLQLAFALAAVSCLVRPTSAVIWVFLSAELFWRSRKHMRTLGSLASIVLTTAISTLIVTLFTDTLYYGEATFTPYNFLITNLSSVSLFYGQSQWHYYLSQGLPIIMNVSIPFFLSGIWSASRSGIRHQKTLAASIVWVVLVYSTLGHKEWRFIHPLLPLMLVFASKGIVDRAERSKQKTGKDRRPNAEKNNVGKWLWMCSLGILPGIYVMRLHGRAQISVIHYLRSIEPSVLRSVGFLMPCHSTPWQSYLHRPELDNKRIWAIGCEPPLSEDITIYKDQTTIFYSSPLKYLKTNFPGSVDPSFPPSPLPSTKPGTSPPTDGKWDHRWPSHLVFFGALMSDIQGGPKVEAYVRELGYREVWAEINGFEEDWRRRGGVKVWQWHNFDKIDKEPIVNVTS